MAATREQRQADIEAAAYALLAEHGYAGTSMLSVAKAARASNETLYRWYGDKLGLFRTMIERNAEMVRSELETAVVNDVEPVETLRRAAPVLLRLLTGERSVVLNRAAAADASGELGAAIAAGGRDSIGPLFEAVFDAAIRRRQLRAPSAREATETFFHLLIGDIQVRRVIGVAPALSEAEIAARSDRALAALLTLYARP